MVAVAKVVAVLEKGGGKMKVTIAPEVLPSIASLAIAASKDKVTPVIMNVALRRNGDKLEAYATDRYMVAAGTYEAKLEEWGDDDVMLVPAELLKRALTTYKSVKFHGAPVVVSVDGNMVTVTVNGDQVLTEHEPQGFKFPVVWKLFDTEYPAGVERLLIRPDFIAKLAKIVPPEIRPEKQPGWHFRFYSTESGKPAPVYAEYKETMRVLIQPMVDKR